MLTLDKTEKNTLYRVVEIKSDEAVKKRLSELGLIEGTLISRILTAPSGDPSAYLIRGAQIALRNEHAKGVTVEYAET